MRILRRREEPQFPVGLERWGEFWHQKQGDIAVPWRLHVEAWSMYLESGILESSRRSRREVHHCEKHLRSSREAVMSSLSF